jgi:very-short-patch-repair endonuclease
MTAIRNDIDTNDIIKLYLSGIGYYEVGKILGCSPPLVRRRLVSAGINIRSQGEQLAITQQSRGIEWRTANTNAAHDALRGMTRTQEDRCKVAITRELKQLGVAGHETKLSDWLNCNGIEVIQQKSVGMYNIDLALPEFSIAVEVFGGHWHLSGRHAARLPERHKYIRDHGWLPVYIWATTAKPLSFACADYLIALCERMRGGESLIGEKHVIWGNGQRITRGQFNLDHLA